MQRLVVIDTNILISALLSRHIDAATVQVMDAVYDRKIIPIFNEEILAEYENVLRRRKFGFSEDRIYTVLKALKDNGIHVERIMTGEILPDPKDLVFYEICMAKRNEDSMLVTGNMKHFPVKPYIVTPNELIEIINK